MSRKPKFDKATKVKACKDYINGIGSYESIARSLNVDSTTVTDWHTKFVIHGESVFETPNMNKAHSKEFKLTVINDYISGKTTMRGAASKHNISHGMISNWLKKYYNGIELKDYDPKGDVYTMKSRKTTFEERLEIVKWVIANDMNYKEAANKFVNSYANIYKWTKAYISVGSEALKEKKTRTQK